MTNVTSTPAADKTATDGRAPLGSHEIAVPQAFRHSVQLR